MRLRTSGLVACGLLVAVGVTFVQRQRRPPLDTASPEVSLAPTATVPSSRPASGGSAIVRPEAVPRSTAEDRFIGVLLARKSVELAPRVDGRVREVHVRVGEHVAAEAPIATLDLLSVGSDLAMADADLRAAQAEHEKTAVELVKAEDTLTRQLALFREALTSGEQLASVKYEGQLAKLRVLASAAQTNQKRERVEQLRRIARDAEIRAPFEGVIALRYLDPGANVTPATAVVRIVSTEDMIVRFAVPESAVGTIHLGKSVRVEAARSTDAVTAVIDKIAPEIDAASRMLTIEATLRPTTASHLLSGEGAHVSLMDPSQPQGADGR